MKDIFKQSVLSLEGYISPPQKDFRVKLNQNESPFDVPADLKEELTDAAKSIPWNRYPINESPLLTGKLAQRHGVTPNQILLGNGSNQLFQTLLTAIIEPGDAVLYTPPTFSLFELFVQLYEGRLLNAIQLPGMGYPLDNVMDFIYSQQPKLILMCSPNNPTGGNIDLEYVETMCEASSGLIFFDEAYAEFAGYSAIDLLNSHNNVLVSRTFSKAFSMAGLRFGYFVGHESLIQQLRKVNIPYTVNVFTELVATRLLDHRDRMQEQVDWIISERDRMSAEMRDLPNLVVYPSSANFILMGAERLNLFQRLKERGVLVRDVGEYPFLQDHQRVTVGFREENDIFLRELRDILTSEDKKS